MYLDCSGHSWESFWEVTRWVAVGVVGALAVGAIAAGIIISGGLGAVLIGAGAGAILGGLTGASIAVSNGTDISTGILSGAIKGAALGAAAPLSGFGLAGFGTMIGTTFIAGSASYAIDRFGNGNSFNLGDMLIVGGSTSIQGMLSFGVGKLFNIGGKVDLVTKLTISYLSKVYAGHIGFAVDLITSYAIGSPWTAQELATNYAAIWLS
ncbi:Uncharacterised protein [Acholeplasma oculi]|nr:hypothetical protein [Acholeplasma oculi]SKC49119.1 hypothetical protein SAMN02745122_1379 [Acholeplasma oculi]SUT92182.1 Uncharacterised protein [Acholeplasma oculi]